MVEVERGGEHGDELELELEPRVAGIEGSGGDGRWRRRRRGGLGGREDGGDGGCGSSGGHDGWMALTPGRRRGWGLGWLDARGIVGQLHERIRALDLLISTAARGLKSTEGPEDCGERRQT